MKNDTRYWKKYNQDAWEHTAEQGSNDWKDSRRGRVTTTKVAAIAGHDFFNSLEDTLLYIVGEKEKVFDQKALDRMKHGTVMESKARDFYISYMKNKYGKELKVLERGMITPTWNLYLGASTDGDIYISENGTFAESKLAEGKLKKTEGILEIKCPRTGPYKIKSYLNRVENGWKPPKHYHGHIYDNYYDQMQTCMAVMNKKWCDFVYYCTEDKFFFRQTIHFNEEYWKEDLYPKVNTFIEKQLKPKLQELSKATEGSMGSKFPLMPPV